MINGFLSKIGAPAFIVFSLVILAVIFGIKPPHWVRMAVVAAAALYAFKLCGTLLMPELYNIADGTLTRFDYFTGISSESWSLSAAIASASSLGVFIILISVILNFIMLFSRTTRTLNLDLWNCWQAAFVGVLVQTLMNNFYAGLAVAVIVLIFVFAFSDLVSPRFQTLLGTEGITVTQLFLLSFTPISYIINLIFDLIPYTRERKVTLDDIAQKYGIFGEPPFFACIAGLVLGLVFTGDFYKSVALSALLCACCLILPSVLKLFSTVLRPLTCAIKKFAETKSKSSISFNLGLGPSLGFGSPIVILCAFVITPFVMILSVILPGCDIVPLSDAPMIFYIVLASAILSRGCIVRSVVCSVFSCVSALYCSTYIAPLVTAAAVDYASFSVGAPVNNLALGGSPITLLSVMLARMGWPGIVLLALIALLCAAFNRDRILKSNSVKSKAS